MGVELRVVGMIGMVITSKEQNDSIFKGTQCVLKNLNYFKFLRTILNFITYFTPVCGWLGICVSQRT